MRQLTFSLLVLSVAIGSLSGCAHTVYGDYRVVSDPPGAHVYTESGRYWGTTPTGRRYNDTSNNPACGTQKIVLKMKGYKDTWHKFPYCTRHRTIGEAKANEETVMVLLDPLEGSPAVVARRTEVIITSSPAGASVFGDGKYWGETPYKTGVRWSSPDSTIDLRFEAPGYQQARATLTPGNDRVHVVLQPTSAADR